MLFTQSNQKNYKMRFFLAILFCCLIAASSSFALELNSTSILSPDQELYSILNLALGTIKSNGKLESILNRFNSDSVGIKCDTGNLYWPEKNSFGNIMSNIVSKNTIRFCRSKTLTPYFNLTNGMEFEIANEMMKVINTQYNTQIQPSWVRLDTNILGFFPSMVAGIYNDFCDAGFGIIAMSPDRTLQGNFTCSYCNGYNGYIQGPRNISTPLSSNTTSLNQTGLVLSAVPGTVYYDMAKKNTLATLLDAPDTTSGVRYDLEGRASVFVGDVLFFKIYECANCKVFRYGTPTLMGIFTRKIGPIGLEIVTPVNVASFLSGISYVWYICLLIVLSIF